MLCWTATTVDSYSLIPQPVGKEQGQHLIHHLSSTSKCVCFIQVHNQNLWLLPNLEVNKIETRLECGINATQLKGKFNHLNWVWNVGYTYIYLLLYQYLLVHNWINKTTFPEQHTLTDTTKSIKYNLLSPLNQHIFFYNHGSDIGHVFRNISQDQNITEMHLISSAWINVGILWRQFIIFWNSFKNLAFLNGADIILSKWINNKRYTLILLYCHEKRTESLPTYGMSIVMLVYQATFYTLHNFLHEIKSTVW